MKMIELVFVRHGETDSNKTHTIQGHLDTPLSEVGLVQAARVGESLKNDTFHMALSSDLKRAKSTGEAICSANPSLDNLELLEVLRERCFGDLEGKPYEAMVEALKGKNSSEKSDWGPPNGETGPMFRTRVEKFIKVLGEKSRDLKQDVPVVLVTSHGGFIRDFNFTLVEKYKCKMPGKEGEYGRIAPNTGVSRYRMSFNEEGGLVSVECTQLYNKDHLAGLSITEPKLYGL